MVHAWVLRPSAFKKTQSYPLLYLIHGGPEMSWNDEWSTTWNPAIFAEEGYVVVMPNITGSVGFGQGFVEEVKGQWGGKPYVDLLNGFQYIKDNMPFIDTTRSAAWGFSFGGYMVNWMAGQALGKEFKALITEAGVFDTTNFYSSDRLQEDEFQGNLWDNRANYERWNPARHAGSWKTPQLVIHGGLDLRVPISEGVAAFTILQSRGIESKFLTFPDESHWVSKPENALHWHRTVLGWINRFTAVDKKA